MSLDLLNQLEEKVATTINALDKLRQEIDQLKEENADLRAEKQVWEEKLNGLLGKFSELETAAQQTENFSEETPADENEEQRVSSWS
ncbi:cell division protein ZapB [Marinospirillum celere]|uniref:Cell division protein ZapB n=1 Tax=Marinospirillum celere TaxID=1122252 RepID=A0A1I1I4M5_9GAMM|nr:cell division protein ZapB [Marinospirillum celere]SFC28643.1 cell division protein ZapB [Marinospirillum celere]